MKLFSVRILLLYFVLSSHICFAHDIDYAIQIIETPFISGNGCPTDNLPNLGIINAEGKNNLIAIYDPKTMVLGNKGPSYFRFCHMNITLSKPEGTRILAKTVFINGSRKFIDDYQEANVYQIIEFRANGLKRNRWVFDLSDGTNPQYNEKAEISVVSNCDGKSAQLSLGTGLVFPWISYKPGSTMDLQSTQIELSIQKCN